jgi:N-acyl-D-amino-acid deacylase
MNFSGLSALVTLLALSPLPGVAADAANTILIHNVVLVDGTGAPGYAGAVRLGSGKILAVERNLPPKPGERIYEGGGRTLAPGFIDTHSHHSVWEQPMAPCLLSQGVTTIVLGQDGTSTFPLHTLWTRLEQQPAAVNVASYSGHNTVRRAVLGLDFRRHATAMELAQMRERIEIDMRAGALGLSTGLAYDPGSYASIEEVVALAGVAGRFGRRYISHIRNEGRGLWESVDELLRVGRENRMPVQISHAKLAQISLWGRAQELISRLEAARAGGVDVTLDVYPYDFWQSTMKLLLPKRDYTDLAAARFALTEEVKPEGVRVVRFNADPSIVGRTFDLIAAERKISPEQLLLDLTRQSVEAKAAEQILCSSMSAADVATLMRWRFANIGSDGFFNYQHPRGAGAFARVLCRYVHEQRALKLEAAVRRMSGQAADNMGFQDRGYLRPGYAADLVLFDLNSVVDRATIEAPTALATGMSCVWVNGQIVWEHERPTGLLSGQSLKPAGAALGSSRGNGG